MSLSPDLGREERGLWQHRGITVLRCRRPRWAFFFLCIFCIKNKRNFFRRRNGEIIDKYWENQHL